MAVAVAVFVVAAAVRLRMLAQPSPFFFGTYDDGVHFTSALALLHGRLPYRDVLFLQPPGILLASAPAAALAPLVGDARAFVLARIAFALIGAGNAVLVAVLLRRFGVAARLSGGLLYALSFPAAYTERTVSLEVLGTTGVLVGVLLLQREDRGRRWALLAGAAAGAAIGFKVWYVVPFVVLAVSARRRAAPFLLGGAAAGCLVYLPFFLQAPAAMWRDTVTAQLGRPDQGIPVTQRIRSIVGLDRVPAPGHWWQLAGLGGTALLLAVLAVLVVLALRTPGARLFVALLAACVVLLLVSPSYLQHYATLTAAPLALVAGVGVGRVAALLPRRAAVPVVAVAVVAALSAFLTQDLDVRAQRLVPRAELQAVADGIPGCIVADDPTVLVLTGLVSRDLEHGCTLQADPSGVNFTLAPPGRPQLLRPENPAFQREIVGYLHGADAYLLVRGADLGLSPASRRILERDPVLHRDGRFTVHGSRPRSSGG